VYHQEIQQPEFPTNDQALGQNGRSARIVGREEFPAGPKEIGKGRRRGIQFVYRFLLQQSLYRFSPTAVRDQYFERPEGNLKGSLLPISRRVAAGHHQRAVILCRTVFESSKESVSYREMTALAQSKR
jgi:hypothetical protein